MYLWVCIIVGVTKKSAVVAEIGYLCVFCLHSSQTGNVGSDRNRGGGGQRVSSTGNDFAASSAFPDSYAGSLDVVLTAKDATVGGVLGDFDLADQFSQSGTVTGTVLSGDTDLLSALSHGKLKFQCDLLDDNK